MAMPLLASLGHTITEKLTRDNFLVWKVQVLPHVRAAAMMGYLDGSIKEPAAVIVTEKEINGKKEITEMPNPEHAIRGLADELAAAGKPLEEDDIVSHILEGLMHEPDYNGFVTSISTRAATDRPIGLSELFSLLLSAEARITAQHAAFSAHHSANLAAKGGRDGYGGGRGGQGGGRGGYGGGNYPNNSGNGGGGGAPRQQNASNGATDVVIGVIDTGVYPEDRASFAADPSLPPPPSKFRGGCVSGPSFNGSALCNNKLVGAKFFHSGLEAARGRALSEDLESPLDTNGHGIHTASTAAGSAVADAAFFDYARGNAVGMAPGARIAVYKACWEEGCASSDILAAFDEAIADGVDVISVSLGAVGNAPEFYDDTTAVGAFRAVSRGIVVSASAGNSGPGDSTACNIAPWFLTVGASTLNRQFPADVVLGNGETFTGTSLYAGEPLAASKIPLVYGGDVGSNVCEEGKLNATMVAGKIVLCDPGVNARAAKPYAVKLAGGAGAILASAEAYGEQAISSPHIHPATAIPFAAAEKIRKYISMQKSPTATIVMAAFSSRGPNFRAPEIFKPDVTAPGTGAVQHHIGTSMSCPHVSGIAALLRQKRPEWSPATIKSALMTTAYNVDNVGAVIGDMSIGDASTPFARGAGHIHPNRAVNPGLVYDAGAEEYITFLCALGYTAEQIAVFDSSTNCSTHAGSSVGDHNYPAFSVVFTTNKLAVVRQRRVVRNVGGAARATYRAKVTAPDGVRVTVIPRTLRFTATQKTREYVVTFAQRIFGSVTKNHTFGSIEWSDRKHSVMSPIAITWPTSQVADM
ncbi:hypothetical protein VPH35_118545 [Triticum aestivum]